MHMVSILLRFARAIREGDVDTLLQRELSPVPLSRAILNGCLRLASSTSDLGIILQKNNQSQPPITHHKTCTIVDGMAAVESLGNTTDAKSFGEWSDNFTAFVVSHYSDKCTRADVVFDRYLPNSIKGVTRAKRKRGKRKGIRRDVESREQRIGISDRFIVVEENKARFALSLSTEMSQRYGTHPGREMVISGGFREILNVWSSDASRESLQELSSDHEEADTRIVLHARDAAVRGYHQVNVFCRDTDVLMAPSGAQARSLSRKLFVLRYIPNKKIHSIPQDLIARGEEEVAASLPYHHWL